MSDAMNAGERGRKCARRGRARQRARQRAIERDETTRTHEFQRPPLPPHPAFHSSPLSRPLLPHLPPLSPLRLPPGSRRWPETRRGSFPPPVLRVPGPRWPTRARQVGAQARPRPPLAEAPSRGRRRRGAACDRRAAASRSRCVRSVAAGDARTRSPRARTPPAPGLCAEQTLGARIPRGSVARGALGGCPAARVPRRRGRARSTFPSPPRPRHARRWRATRATRSSLR